MTTTHAPAVDALSDLQSYQKAVDELCWALSGDDRAKARHISLHLTIAAGKLARVEERADHGQVDESVLDDVAADLVIYALQLATLRGRQLGDLYDRRVKSNLDGVTQHR